MNKVDILFSVHNRLAFTEQSWYALLQNTNWSLVDTFFVYLDNCTDGSKEFIQKEAQSFKGKIILFYTSLQFPVAIMNHFLQLNTLPIFAKIDNDVIVPPFWLDQCIKVIAQDTKLDLLGIEPAWSRTQAPWRGSAQAVVDPKEVASGPLHYIPCTAIGGIGLMRKEAFLRNESMIPHSKYGGFTDWQWRNKNLVKGWMAPALKLFLLDRLPMNPWKRLSERYIELGSQRPWTDYDNSVKHLWEWWKPVKTPTIVDGLACADLDEIDSLLRSN